MEEYYRWWPEGAEEPNWLEVFKWAKNLAWIIAKGPYRTEEMITELASEGYMKVYDEWQRYRQTSVNVRTWKMGKAIVNAQKEFIKKDKLVRSPKEKDCSHPTTFIALSEYQEVFDTGADLEGQVESRIDLPVVVWAIQRFLKLSERRVMLMVIQFPELSDAEIAEKLGDMTPGSVRAHKCNARKKLKKYLGWN